MALYHLLRLQSVTDVGPDSTAVFLPPQLCIASLAFPIELLQKGSKLTPLYPV